MYFIDHHNGIALWNRTTVKSSFGSRRSNSADSRLGCEVPEFRQKLAILSLRDSIHGVACGSRQLRLRNNKLELGGSHAASPLRWRGSFLGSFVNSMPLLWSFYSCISCSIRLSSFFLFLSRLLKLPASGNPYFHETE